MRFASVAAAMLVSNVAGLELEVAGCKGGTSTAAAAEEPKWLGAASFGLIGCVAVICWLYDDQTASVEGGGGAFGKFAFFHGSNEFSK